MFNWCNSEKNVILYFGFLIVELKFFIRGYLDYGRGDWKFWIK